MAVRAKFKVVSKSERERDSFEVTLQPVVGGSPENEDFYKWTPGGSLALGTISKSAAEQFVVGHEYYVDFTPAEPAA